MSTTPCPGNLELCGVPCGCAGKNPTHRIHEAAVRARDRQPGHVGWPPDLPRTLERVRAGLPVYWPTDPKDIDQAPYLRFAAERGPNTQ